MSASRTKATLPLAVFF
eukprot:Stramenopile-MAST_4_protein_6801